MIKNEKEFLERLSLIWIKAYANQSAGYEYYPLSEDICDLYKDYLTVEKTWRDKDGDQTNKT